MKKIGDFFGGSAARRFGGLANSMRNYNIFLSEKRHNFSWKLGLIGGVF